MGLKATWFDTENSIILYEFEGQWTWDDLDVLIGQANVMTNSVAHRVDTIIDLEGNQGMQAGALLRFRTLTVKAPANWGMAVFVGANEYVENLLITLTKVFPKIGERYVTARTIDKARGIILERRSKQPNPG
jgi:hypothetical protein